MMFDIGILERIEEAVGRLSARHNLTANSVSFDNNEVRYRTIFTEIIFIRVRFLR